MSRFPGYYPLVLHSLTCMEDEVLHAHTSKWVALYSIRISTPHQAIPHIHFITGIMTRLILTDQIWNVQMQNPLSSFAMNRQQLPAHIVLLMGCFVNFDSLRGLDLATSVNLQRSQCLKCLLWTCVVLCFKEGHWGERCCRCRSTVWSRFIVCKRLNALPQASCFSAIFEIAGCFGFYSCFAFLILLNRLGITWRDNILEGSHYCGMN